MPFRKSPSMDRAGVERIAEGWGKVVARRVHEEVGPDLDLDADDIEQMAAAARAVARGTIADLLERKAALLGAEQPCPTCRRPCAVRRAPRTIDFWGGEVAYAEPARHCPACRRDFFPQRPALRLTPHDYSPSVLRKLVRCAAREPSFREAAEVMAELAEVVISGRQLGRIAHEVGEQLRADRDEQVDRLRAGTLGPQVETRPALAVIEVDGGRLEVRGDGPGPTRRPGARTRSRSWPRWPTSSRIMTPSRSCLIASATGASSSRSSAPSAGPGRWARRGPRRRGPPSRSSRPPGSRSVRGAGRSWRCAPTWPRPLRSSTSGRWSPPRRGGGTSRRRPAGRSWGTARPGSGGCSGSIFPTFMAIVDLLHALGHVFAAAKAAASDTEGRWELFQAWAGACWKGRVGQVIEELRTWRDAQASFFGGDPERLADDDPRRIIARVLGYLEENRERMDYPRYGRAGLPWTTSHVESTVKVFNRRVKGSEKFWSEAGAEAMLQLRAAFLSEDGRLDRHLTQRPCGPFRNYKARKTGEAAQLVRIPNRFLHPARGFEWPPQLQVAQRVTAGTLRGGSRCSVTTYGVRSILM